MSSSSCNQSDSLQWGTVSKRDDDTLVEIRESRGGGLDECEAQTDETSRRQDSEAKHASSKRGGTKFPRFPNGMSGHRLQPTRIGAAFKRSTRLIQDLSPAIPEMA